MEILDMHDQFLKLQLRFWVFITGEDGQDLIEYGLIVTAIALAAIGGIEQFASAVASMFSKIGNSIS
jgi:Flp pilus assembly pilin Flp